MCFELIPSAHKRILLEAQMIFLLTYDSGISMFLCSHQIFREQLRYGTCSTHFKVKRKNWVNYGISSFYFSS